MITVKFFAQIRELVGTSQVTLDSQNITTVADVRHEMGARYPQWLKMADEPMLTACNQEVVDAQHPVVSGDEVAFFPPVTGG